MQMATASIYNAEKTNKQKVYRLFIAHKRRQELWIQQANSTTYLGEGFTDMSLLSKS